MTATHHVTIINRNSINFGQTVSIEAKTDELNKGISEGIVVLCKTAVQGITIAATRALARRITVRISKIIKRNITYTTIRAASRVITLKKNDSGHIIDSEVNSW